MAWLIITSKNVPPSIYKLGAGWVAIGRSESNQFQIVETSISARHCEVCVQEDELLVRDLLSTNGTFVGGRRIAEAVVKAGGTLRLGDVELRFDTRGAGATAGSLLLAGQPTLPTPEPAVPGLFPASDAADESCKVLFVDDSLAFLELFGELCSEFSEHAWKIYKAASADSALALLHEVTVDLVVLDIGMPLMDGLQLLTIITRRYPGQKIAVVTGNATPERRAYALAHGAELFLEKPVTADGLSNVFKMLEELLLWDHHREGFTGALQQVNLQEVLHVECGGRHSSVLEIRNPVLHGEIYIENGDVIHAVAGELTGQTAFHHLLALRGGDFHVQPFRQPKQRTIDVRWEFLLMDAARMVTSDTAFLTKTNIRPRA